MQLNSPLSATARLFQPQAALLSTLVDHTPRDHPARNGLTRDSPPMGLTTGSSVRRVPPNHHYTSDEEGVSTDTSTSRKSLCKRHGSRGNRGNQSGSDSNETLTSGGRQKKRMDSLVRSKSPNLGARRVITMWPMPSGSGPVASPIIVNIMRIPISCL